MIDNLAVKWTMPENPRGHDESIQTKDSFSIKAKGRNHTRKVIECEKLLGVEENIRSLMLQAEEELY